jgi:Eukaryotic aspartyl protease
VDVSVYKLVLIIRVELISSLLLAAWISVPISGQTNLTDATETYFNYAPIMIGTPPQVVDMTINTYSTLLAAFAEDCTLCAGSTFFDRSQSSTFEVHTLLRFPFKLFMTDVSLFCKSSNRTWSGSSNQLTGSYFEDSIGFGNSLTVDKADFGINQIPYFPFAFLMYLS